MRQTTWAILAGSAGIVLLVQGGANIGRDLPNGLGGLLGGAGFALLAIMVIRTAPTAQRDWARVALAVVMVLVGGMRLGHALSEPFGLATPLNGCAFAVLLAVAGFLLRSSDLGWQITQMEKTAHILRTKANEEGPNSRAARRLQRVEGIWERHGMRPPSVDADDGADEPNE